MLEKPDLRDEDLIVCLQNAFGVHILTIEFLPLGADVNAAVYRAVAGDGAVYFVKLRRGNFDPMSVLLPRWLSDQGISQIIPPIPTLSGQLWATLHSFLVILYQFVAGQDGYTVALSDPQWREIGVLLKRIHTAILPTEWIQRLPREHFSAEWRERLKIWVVQLDTATFADSVATALVNRIQEHRVEIVALVERTERLAQQLRAAPSDYCVCHTDMHAGNILITETDRIYLVDWDNPLLAPKERDLMYIGGGQFGRWRSASEEQRLFYAGYGATQVDPIALAYYRYERIVQDIVVECDHIVQLDALREDRELSLRYLNSNFGPNGMLAIAYAADTTISPA